MANTYTQIYIQVVFAVSGRANLLLPAYKEEINKYITGIVSGQGQKLIAINGMPDHVHLLVGLRPDMALSALIREVKAGSSKFINGKRWVRGRFCWQEGFGAFSYAHSQLGAVVKYIQNQEQHHSRKSFRDEYTTLLRKFDVAFEHKYVFDFLDEPATLHVAPAGLGK